MQIEFLALPEIVVIRPAYKKDSRGFFSETYTRRALAEAGIDLDFVQDNHVLSYSKGTVRGLHFQIPPFEQAKLVRVGRGSVFDVAVDIRAGSPTFGRHISAVISAEEWNQILIPVGFAHGLVTLEPNTEVIYKVSDYYSPEHDKGILWNDPDLGIDWPVGEVDILLSEKDQALPRLSDLPAWFNYGGATYVG